MTHTFTIRVSRGWIVIAAVVMAVLLAAGIGACTNSGGGNAAEGAAQGASTNLLEPAAADLPDQRTAAEPDRDRGDPVARLAHHHVFLPARRQPEQRGRADRQLPVPG